MEPSRMVELKELFRFQQLLRKIAWDIPEIEYNKLQLRIAERIMA